MYRPRRRRTRERAEANAYRVEAKTQASAGVVVTVPSDRREAKLDTKDSAMALSDALVALGQSHTITVGVRDGNVPRERYYVNVTPVLSFSPTDISALQRLADSFNCGVAYINGSFTFTKADRG